MQQSLNWAEPLSDLSDLSGLLTRPIKRRVGRAAR